MTMKELRSMTLQGLDCCIKRDPDDRPRCDSCAYTSACLNRLKCDAKTVLAASLPARAVRRAICKADKPDCVTNEQFEAVMANVCIALLNLEDEYGTLIGTEE